MKLKRQTLFTTLLALVGGSSHFVAAADNPPPAQTLYPLGSQSSFTGPDHLFSGEVQVDLLFPANEHAHFSGAHVTFAPGARSAWHSHPAGQHLIVTEGIALTATRAGEVHAFSVGESVWCPPDIDHWHGATPHAAMTHLVITGSRDGDNVIWKEKVTDAEYAAAQGAESSTGSAALSPQQQAMVPIAAYASKGNLASLEQAIIQGLDAGLSVNEIKELQIHLYAYTGFPRALNAIATLMRVVEARRASGIDDPVGAEPSTIAAGQSSRAIGERVQTELVGAPVSGPLFDFAPVMNTYLQSHLFGDIFARGVLDYQQRELVTVSALASLEGAEPQLRAHIRMATNVGVTEQQLKDVAAVLGVSVGKIEARRVDQAIQAILHPPQG